LEKFVEIDFNAIASKHSLAPDDIIKAVKIYQGSDLLKYIPENSEGISFLMERKIFEKLPVDFDDYERRKERAFEKLDRVEEYAKTWKCKRNYILNYFHADGISGTCQKCSSCHKSKPDSYSVINKITIHKKTADSPYINNDTYHKNKETEVQIDEETIRKNIIDAVGSLKQHYFKTTISEFLIGKSSYNVVREKLDENRLFGALQDISRKRVSGVIDQLVSEQILARTNEEPPKIKLKDKYISTKDARQTVDTESKKPEENQDLFVKLKKLRRIVVFISSKTEEEIFSTEAIKDAAKKISTGMPYFKLFLLNQATMSTGEAKELINMLKSLVPEASRSKPENDFPPKQLEILEFLKAHSLPETESKFKINTAEAAMLIQKALEAGFVLDRKKFTDDSLIKKIKFHLYSNFNASLKDIRLALPDDVDFPILRIAVAFARQELSGED